MKKILNTLPVLITLLLTTLLHFVFKSINYPILELLLLFLAILFLAKQITAEIFIDHVKYITTGQQRASMLQAYSWFRSKVSIATYINIACIVLFCLEERLEPVFMVLFDVEHLQVNDLLKMMGLIGAYFTILTAFNMREFTYKMNAIKFNNL